MRAQAATWTLCRTPDAARYLVFVTAVADAIARGSNDVSAVVVACERRRRERAQPVPVDVAMPAHIPDREVIPHALEDYDEP